MNSRNEGDKMKRKYDLEERTEKFGKAVITFAKKIPRNVVTLPILSQFVKAGTSIGANYCEADCAEPRKDFEHKIGICKKETKETQYWLKMLVTAVPELQYEAGLLRQEAQELQFIFITIIKNSKANSSV